MECWAHVKSHFCAAEMLVTDEGEIQLWGKTQLILLRSQADAGFNLHQSLALCPSISHLKTNRLTHPPSLRVSILTPLSPPAATSFFCSFFTGNVLKVLSVVTTPPHLEWPPVHSPGAAVGKISHTSCDHILLSLVASLSLSFVMSQQPAAQFTTPFHLKWFPLLASPADITPSGFYFTLWSAFSVSFSGSNSVSQLLNGGAPPRPWLFSLDLLAFSH